mgnify:CR=1 FL=1
MLKESIKNVVKDYLPKTDRHDFEYTVSELIGMSENSSNLIASWHGKALSNEILKYKTSDTMFLLGSGPSINDISKEQWEHIAKHNSIGFNYWFVHDFVPTYYMYQGVDETMLELLKDTNRKYKNVPFLLRGADIAAGRFDTSDERINVLKNNPVYYLNTYPISSKCSIEIRKLLKYVEALGFFTFDKIADFVPKFRGSLGLLISLSYQMGYKKIILCGMDMKDSSHFWDSSFYSQVKDKYNLPSMQDTNLNTFTDGSHSPNTVPKYVYSLRDWVLDKHNVEILLLNSDSCLYPELDIYDGLSKSINK